MQLQRIQAYPGNSLCSTHVLKGQLKMLNRQICSLCVTGQHTNKRQQEQQQRKASEPIVSKIKMHLVESAASANLQGAAIIGRESCMCRSYKVHNGNWWMQRLSQQEESTSRSESCYLEHVEKELFLGGEQNKSQRGWDPQTVASAASTRYTVRTLGRGTSMTFTQFGQEWSKHVQRLCCAWVNKMPLGHYGFSEYKQKPCVTLHQ